MATDLKSMKLAPRKKTAEEKMYPTMCNDPDDMPQYPYGLCLSLEEDQLKALGMTEMPKSGTTITLQAKAEVTNSGERLTQGGAQRTLGLQITELAVE